MTERRYVESHSDVLRHPHEQMLKLVAKGFYKELINYGVKEPEILTVAGHLLDNVSLKSNPNRITVDTYNTLFSVKDIHNDWNEKRELSISSISITPLGTNDFGQIGKWTNSPEARRYFYPHFPDTPSGLEQYFQSDDREYFRINSDGKFVGIIGADQVDNQSKKLEMRKLVGASEQRGKGIGKRAIFLFLYYAYLIKNFEKVFLHSLDINLRNLSLNGKFGFYLEGVFFEDITIDGERHDLVRMVLSRSVWQELFA